MEILIFSILQRMRSQNWQKNQNFQKSLVQFFKHIGRYMHANFQLSKLFFGGGDRFFLWKSGSKIAIFWQILTKLTTLKGHKILKNQNFRICWIKSLDHWNTTLNIDMIFVWNKVHFEVWKRSYKMRYILLRTNRLVCRTFEANFSYAKGGYDSFWLWLMWHIYISCFHALLE